MYFIANWKMYGDLALIKKVKNLKKLSKSKLLRKTNIIYCPPLPFIYPLINLLRNSKIEVGAQNCDTHKDCGAFTGQINPRILKNLGCKYIILGHSETRLIGDSDKSINLKIKSSIKEKLKVIFCIGETLSQKKKKITNVILRKQIINGLKNIKNFQKIIIAYEPVWSIGSGVIPKTNELENSIKNIRSIIKKKFGKKNVKILYGGSVSQHNIKQLKNIKSINGFLIGGASLNYKKFIDIIKKATK